MSTPMFSFLRGSWRFQRQILTEGRKISVFGSATWIPSGPENFALLYNEIGTLTAECLPQREVRASYVWQFPADIGDWCARVCFPDGRLFFELDLTSGSHSSIYHACEADHYTGAFHVHQGELLVKWIVTGPQKDYVSETTFWKGDAESPQARLPDE